MRIALAQQRRTGFAAGRRAVRQQQAHAGALAAQRIDQRRRRARLAERHRVHPDPTGACNAGVEAETLGHRVPVQRLGAAAPPQAQRVERLQQSQQQRIGEPREAAHPLTAALTVTQAAQTSSTVGVVGACTDTWCAWPWAACGPVRHAVGKL